MSIRKDKKLTRSRKLKKYGSVYKSFLKNRIKVPPKNEDSLYYKGEKDPIYKRTSSSRVLRPGTLHQKDSNNQLSSRKKKGTSKNLNSKNSRKFLNPYQIFVRQESKKSKYLNTPGKERLIKIAQEWKKYKAVGKKIKRN